MREQGRSLVGRSSTLVLNPDLVGEKTTRFYGYQCTFGQHMKNSRLYTQMLSMRISFPFIHCLCPPRNGAGVLRDQRFSPVCVFGPSKETQFSIGHVLIGT